MQQPTLTPTDNKLKQTQLSESLKHQSYAHTITQLRSVIKGQYSLVSNEFNIIYHHSYTNRSWNYLTEG